MALKKEDFTDEQWAAIEAETDRRVTTASETARKNAVKASEAETDTKIADAIERERAKLEADEAGKLEIQRKEIADAQAKLARDVKSLAATKKLVGAGMDETEVESLLPMFVAVDDKSFDMVVDNFIKVTQANVKLQVDRVKQDLLGNATPPSSPSGAPVNAEAAARAAVAAGDDVGAVDILLNAASTQ